MADPNKASLTRFTGPLQAVRSALRKLALTLRLPLWFPHIPLSLGLAATGLILLLTASQEGLRILVSDDIVRLSVNSLSGGSSTVPRVLLGVAMMIMSIGLVLRSRFAWVVSLLLTTSTLVVAVKFQSAYSIIAYVDGLLLVALLLAHKAFDRSSVAAGTLFAVVSGLMLLMYATFGAYYLGAEFNPPIKDLVTALYYSIVTMSTVGYGDITPQTGHARLFTVSVIILGITVFATSISAIIGPIVGGSLQRILNRKEKRMKRKDHYIIAGQTSLARNTYLELRKRNQPVTLIFARPPAGNDFADADVIIGDATNVDVLRSAGAEDARAVIAMRDDDSENAFIVLAVKELECTPVPQELRGSGWSW